MVSATLPWRTGFVFIVIFWKFEAEMKAVQTSSTLDTKTFDIPATINLKPPPIERHKSFDEDDFAKKPVVNKKTVTVPANVTAFTVADLQMATGSFSVDNRLGEGSFGRIYRAQFDDGKVRFFPNKSVMSFWVVMSFYLFLFSTKVLFLPVIQDIGSSLFFLFLRFL